jgi:hypothetical protein
VDADAADRDVVDVGGVAVAAAQAVGDRRHGRIDELAGE